MFSPSHYYWNPFYQVRELEISDGHTLIISVFPFPIGSFASFMLQALDSLGPFRTVL